MTDPIADMLTRIRNAKALSKPDVSVPFSDLNFRIAKILEKQGFLERVEKRGRAKRKEVRIFLKYSKGVSRIHELTRISKPGQRIYLSAKEIRPVRQGYGIAIVSTPKGVMTDEEARKQRLGGEVLCEVW